MHFPHGPERLYSILDICAESAIPGELTQASPLAQLLSIRYLDQGDLVLGAKRNDQLLVCLLLAGLLERYQQSVDQNRRVSKSAICRATDVQNADVCLATIQSLGGLAQTSGKTIVHQRKLENTLEGLEHAHLSL